MDKDLSKQTLSRYIKEAIILAHKEVDPSSLSDMSIKAHLVRHVATSLNALRNFSVDDLLKAGAWTSPSTFLSHYVQSFSFKNLSRISEVGSFLSAGVRY